MNDARTDMQDRWLVVGKVGSGKTAMIEKLRDEWLQEHPFKKALIIDPKGTHSTRWFEPHLQIEKPVYTSTACDEGRHSECTSSSCRCYCHDN